MDMRETQPVFTLSLPQASMSATEWNGAPAYQPPCCSCTGAACRGLRRRSERREVGLVKGMKNE